jgi:hypothetical protein
VDLNARLFIENTILEIERCRRVEVVIHVAIEMNGELRANSRSLMQG